MRTAAHVMKVRSFRNTFFFGKIETGFDSVRPCCSLAKLIKE